MKDLLLRQTSGVSDVDADDISGQMLSLFSTHDVGSIKAVVLEIMSTEAEFQALRGGTHTMLFGEGDALIIRSPWFRSMDLGIDALESPPDMYASIDAVVTEEESSKYTPEGFEIGYYRVTVYYMSDSMNDEWALELTHDELNSPFVEYREF